MNLNIELKLRTYRVVHFTRGNHPIELESFEVGVTPTHVAEKITALYYDSAELYIDNHHKKNTGYDRFEIRYLVGPFQHADVFLITDIDEIYPYLK